MVLNEQEATAAARDAVSMRKAESEHLDTIHKYLRGQQSHPVSPKGLPGEVTRLGTMSRVNLMKIVVNSVSQALYVDGYRQPRESEDAPVWEVWQRNQMDAAQVGVHRSALTYGTAYVSVLPGEPVPVIRGHSPRRMMALYSEEDDLWPQMALQAEPSIGKWLYRLFEPGAVHRFESDANGDELKFIKTELFDLTFVPVVRFVNERDLDGCNDGEVWPLIHLQDQIDLTTFSLLVAQHYGAFRQRWIIGWTADSENERLKAGAQRLWSFDDSPEEVKVGEFEQTDLAGFLDSREASMRHAATLSQTPVHELIGQLVNLSAEALVASEAGHNRKVMERQTSFGESWEQTLALAGQLGGFEVSEMAQVRWRDTESRALSQTVDALGKLAQMLSIPVEVLWDKVPGLTQQDVERAKALLKAGDSITNLMNLLESQGNPVPATNEAIPPATGAAA